MADESELPRNSGAGQVTGVRAWVGDGEVGLVTLPWEVVALCGCCPGRLAEKHLVVSLELLLVDRTRVQDVEVRTMRSRHKPRPPLPLCFTVSSHCAFGAQ